MSTHQPRSSASSRPSSRGGRDRKSDSRSRTGSATGVRTGFAGRSRPDLWPASRYGRTPLRLTALAQVAWAIETEPRASPNCASIAEWLEGISPYSHRVPVRAGISQSGVPGAVPNSGTGLAAWKAPQTYRHRDRSTPLAARCCRIRVHMYRSRSSSRSARASSPRRSRRNRLPIITMTCR